MKERQPRLSTALPLHYLKTAIRRFRRQKVYAFINIAGLSVGMACFLLILTSVQFDLSYDRFHGNSDRLFRVALRSNDPGIEEYAITTPEILSESLRTGVPEVTRSGLVQNSRNALLQSGSGTFKEDGLFADESFFELFSFDLVRGHPSGALEAPGSIVLSEDLAGRLFGAEDPVGRTLRYSSRYLSRDLNVTGIVRRPPKNSHLQFEYLISVATLAADPELSSWFRDWDTYAFVTYVELRDKRLAGAAENKAAALFRQARPEINERNDLVYLQPVTDIHLRSRVEGATATNDRIRAVSLYGAVALLVLLIAGVNSMTLSMALAGTRAREISLRKVIGAGRAQVLRQSLAESYLFSFLALLLALWLFHTLFPVLTKFLGHDLTLAEVRIAPLVLTVAGTFLFVGAFSGLYPSLNLARFEPVAALRKAGEAGPLRLGARNLLVIFQFTAVVVLMIGTIVVTRQLEFIRRTDPGFLPDDVVIVPLAEEETVRAAGLLKTRFLECPGVLGVTVSDSNPLSFGMSLGGHSIQKDNGETFKIDVHLAHVDHDFLKVFGMRIAEGRDFSEGPPPDTRGVIVNQAFVRKTGWTRPLDMRFLDTPILGIVEDFHFDSLHEEIEPAVIRFGGDLVGRVNLGIRLRPGDQARTIGDLKGIFSEVTAGRPFDFRFLKEDFEGLHRNERRLAAVIGYLEGLALLLGGMGLFGLATYAAERRTKEIGIRKVLGASVSSVVRMISREFLVLVAIANIVAWPVGYVLLRRWLEGFAYRTSLGIGVFAAAGAASLVVAALAVGLHTVRAALSNPLESIRYE